jgi:hypothetical protein
MPLGFVPPEAMRELILTEEQLDVSDRLARSRYAVLDGASGSGKTHIAAAVAVSCAAMGRSVLFLAPRMPLARWLAQTLRPLGVEVQTIDAIAKRILAARHRVPPVRQGFDDPEFFEAATIAARPGQYDLVVIDEWQTTTDLERSFVDRVSEESLRLVVQDSSRDLRPLSSMHIGSPERFHLATPLRSPGRVELFDRAYVDERLEVLPSQAARESVRVTSLEPLEDVHRVVTAAMTDLRARGFSPSEIGLVSCVGRSASAVVTAQIAPQAAPRAFLQTTPQAMTSMAADSFAYFLGLERRAIVVVEASPSLTFRAKRLHCALSRATEYVHLILPKEDVEADPTLQRWPQQR